MQPESERLLRFCRQGLTSLPRKKFSPKNHMATCIDLKSIENASAELAEIGHRHRRAALRIHDVDPTLGLMAAVALPCSEFLESYRRAVADQPMASASCV